MNIYSLEELRFSYDGKFLLYIEKFEMDEKRVGIFGPSGSGKTTFLLNLAFLLKGEWKSFRFMGEDVNDASLERFRRLVSYVSQHPVLLKRSVFENIAYPLMLRKFSKQEIRRRVFEIAELFKLEKLLDAKPWQLSGGQARRVCFARALVFEPKLVLLDEPTADLDEDGRRMLDEAMKKFSDRTSFVIVSHDINWLTSVCEKLYVMRNGTLKEYKTKTRKN
ncbi:ABC transporter [Thermotoga sp. Ku-13t]|uniref:energy-coupling factor ABC transporter ATP-binding protein n=1 Tax=Thermotoga sp. Ku-13t TaxID=1755813 RepID=UPI0013ECA927|nr:ABC transporter ATP-binding protein [Thermotoga sp. Ku-13t]KAF2957796.1 ABC transporter [Thermotoga sp. Ku-13t]